MITVDRPRDTDVHTLADFAELLCLLDADRSASRASIVDCIKDSGVSERAIPRDVDLDDCFSHIEWRSQAFSKWYPFRIINDGRVIQAFPDLSDEMEVYCFLLLCANLPFLNVYHGRLTDAFERVSLACLKGFWPSGGVVKAFGKNEADYVGAKWQRVNALGHDIGASARCVETTFREKDSGDAGIDIVAWLNLDPHERRNSITALGQCACSRDEWVKKQTEISHDRLGNLIIPSSKWLPLLFIPQCFRDGTGEWAVDGDIGMTVIFDRLRIVNGLGDGFALEQVNPPDEFIEFMKTRNDLV
ncbi:hypothetical protein [Chromobacterium violaceum]|uniref:hypothetical protein n=1 Tax=Chromobacterium violaceum TaxID=536 RepID=UPI00143D707F|nr:hypothetical protein [Chromobacterium violaceum]QIY78355.1 hypothetical protein FOB43_03645 [Chromobacterium violaceum]